MIVRDRRSASCAQHLWITGITDWSGQILGGPDRMTLEPNVGASVAVGLTGKISRGRYQDELDNQLLDRTFRRGETFALYVLRSDLIAFRTVEEERAQVAVPINVTVTDREDPSSQWFRKMDVAIDILDTSGGPDRGD
jgi:hypothetical protein